MSCRSEGNLKSPDRVGRAGSSPAPGTMCKPTKTHRYIFCNWIDDDPIAQWERIECLFEIYAPCG